MRKGILTTTLLVLTCGLTRGQTVDKSLTFEVASIKPATPPTPMAGGRIMMRGPSGGPGSKDPGRISYPYMSLKNLLMNAYDVKNYQITGPAWLDTERFDVNATMPPETTKEQFRVMLQNLLAERFKLAVHRETKELPVYDLVVAKGGPKLKESAPVAPVPEGGDAPPPLPSQPTMGPDGFPILPSMGGRAGTSMIMMPGRARMMAQQQTMENLANMLTNQLGRPVKDATGLTAKYDYTLTFTPEGMNGPMGPMGPGVGMAVAVAGPAPAPPPPPGRGGASLDLPEGDAHPTIFGAIQEQLGLRLESKKGNVEIIVVDRMEKVPTEN